MNKIIIGALIAIIAWELGAYIAQRVPVKVEIAQAPAAPKPPEASPPAIKPIKVSAAPKPVRVAPKPKEKAPVVEETVEQIDWPPTAEGNDMSQGVEYQLPNVQDHIDFLKLKRTFLWDKDRILKRQIAAGVDRDSIIGGPDSMPPVFPFRSRVIAMEKELETVKIHAKKGSDTSNPNPWTQPYFDKTEIPPQASEGETYCYYIYDLQGLPNFNEEVDQIVKRRDRELTSNLMKVDSKIRGHNAHNYWGMWWAEYQYQHKLEILRVNANGLRNRIRNIPIGWVKIRPETTKHNWRWPDNFEEFIQQEAEVLDLQLEILETLLRGSD